MTTQNTLWLIDDDPALRLILEDTFIDAGLNVDVFSGAKGAWAKLNDILHGHESRDTLPDVILTDIRMPMMDGLSFSSWVHKNFPELPIVIMTAHSDLKSAVDSYQTGAFEYLPKPFDLDDAVAIIQKSIRPKLNTAVTTDTANKDSHRKTVSSKSNSIYKSTTLKFGKPDKTDKNTAEKTSNRQSTGNSNGDSHDNLSSTVIGKTGRDKATTVESINAASISAASASTKSARKSTKESGSRADKVQTNTSIIGQSHAMQTVFRAIGRLSHSPITVLITGESGTGKELVAGALHEHSPRHNKPFIALNMAAIPHDLIESELFGHEKGAFTGATTLRQGRFEQANGGTLFLDEIGDMPFSTQTRLLRVLANGEFFRVGGQKPIQVDVRIIAATHQNLEYLVKEGKFREDLFYRLNVIRLPLPPLRQRRDDIPELVGFFMARAAIEMDAKPKHISMQAMDLMQAFDWPGNVRQLENACRWITVMATGDVVMIDDLPPELTDFAKQHPQVATDTPPLHDNNTSYLNDFATNSWQHGKAPSIGSVTHADIALSSSHLIDDYDLHTVATPYLSSAVPLGVPSRSTTSTAHSWQQQLQQWADSALASGETDILQLATPEFERVLIAAALKHTKGRKGEAADILGWGRNTLTRKIKLLGLDN